MGSKDHSSPVLTVHDSNGKLICYYSDQRANTTHGQKMVHQVTTDLKNWGPVVDDVYVCLHPTSTITVAERD
jgi:hypothetical protein